jgi:hypothetical protein
MCKAYNILMKSLKPQFKTAVQNYITPTGIWDYMESTYNCQTTVSKVIMFEEFFSTQMKEGASLKMHLAWLKQKVSELTTTGYKLTDEVLAIHLMLSLPPEFGNMHAAMKSTHLDKEFTVAEIKTVALQDEARRKGINTAYTEGALHTQKSVKPEKAACHTEETTVSIVQRVVVVVVIRVRVNGVIHASLVRICLLLVTNYIWTCDQNVMSRLMDLIVSLGRRLMLLLRKVLRKLLRKRGHRLLLLSPS